MGTCAELQPATIRTGTHEPEGLAEVEGPDCQKPSSPMVMRWLGSAWRKCAATVLIHDCPHTQGCSGPCPVTPCLGLISGAVTGPSWHAVLQVYCLCLSSSESEALELRMPLHHSIELMQHQSCPSAAQRRFSG